MLTKSAYVGSLLAALELPADSLSRAWFGDEEDEEDDGGGCCEGELPARDGNHESVAALLLPLFCAVFGGVSRNGFETGLTTLVVVVVAVAVVDVVPVDDDGDGGDGDAADPEGALVCAVAVGGVEERIPASPCAHTSGMAAEEANGVVLPTSPPLTTSISKSTPVCEPACPELASFGSETCWG